MRALKYISWGDTTGYAVAAKAYVRALMDAGVALTWTPMIRGRRAYEAYTSPLWPCASLAPVCNREMDYDTVLIHTVPEYFPEWIERERKPGRRILGYTVWELERLPDHWPAILNRLDGVIVPTHWNAQAFRDSGVTVPVFVVPHLSQFEYLEKLDSESGQGGDHAALNRRLGPLGNDPARFMFYSIAYWSHRKAPYLVLEAYLKAFTRHDRVLLAIKTGEQDFTRWRRHWRHGFRRRHPSPQDAVERRLSGHPDSPPVAVIMDETLSDAEMLALHEKGDCYIALPRAEGWGLGAFEAARLGKPVIMTGYGGQLDFLEPGFAHRVEHRMVPAVDPAFPASHRPSDRWAEPSVDQAAAHMRFVFEHSSHARECAGRVAQRLSGDFSRDAVTAALLRALEMRT